MSRLINSSIKIATRASAVVFAISTVLLFVWVIRGPLYSVAPWAEQVIPPLWQRTQRLPLSSATTQFTTGTECIGFLSNSRYFNPTFKSLTLYRIKLVPVYSKETGPDGKPLYGLYDPDIILLFNLRLKWMLLCLALSGFLPLLAMCTRSHRRQLRGFPLDPASVPEPMDRL